eukprot:TRINITY_DN13863_c0_g1_i1.p1 TRINITY_DN13863_c0_g1~~TRINITY_DN13863_c0_g1_i1.p1  ORF type:complete len:213 (-),score=49.77 TRINITY_DN13863_c0_g1_i1:62-700(-)
MAINMLRTRPTSLLFLCNTSGIFKPMQNNGLMMGLTQTLFATKFLLPTQQRANICVPRLKEKILRENGLITRKCDQLKTEQARPEDIDVLNSAFYSNPDAILQTEREALLQSLPETRDVPSKKTTRRKITAAYAIPPPPPDLTVETFLERIKKNCVEHKDKFASWEELMTMKGRQMKEKGISIKQRKWILRWVERYKQGFPIVYTGKPVFDK